LKNGLSPSLSYFLSLVLVVDNKDIISLSSIFSILEISISWNNLFNSIQKGVILFSPV
jgi:hypothetical protein